MATMLMIQRDQIIGTEDVYYSVWEPTTGGPYFSHSSLRTVINGETYKDAEGRLVWWGRVGTERLPADIDALPAMTTERLLAVREWQAERDERAHAWLRAAGIEGRYSGGECHRKEPWHPHSTTYQE